MAGYTVPVIPKPPRLNKRQVQLVANGDLRQSANEKCWPAQAAMEEALGRAIPDAGYELVRAHPYKPEQGHGFIGSQREGGELVARGVEGTVSIDHLDPNAPSVARLYAEESRSRLLGELEFGVRMELGP